MSRPVSSDDRGTEIRRLFDTLVEVDAAEQSARLDQLCPDRPDLRQEVEALLEAHDRADAVLTDLTQLRPAPPSPEASDVSDPHRLVGRTISHYQVLEHLGGGGMGVVYRARDTKLGRLVALKFLPAHLGFDEEARRRFVREAKAASALDHANICTIYEIGEAEDRQVFIAMACYEGETLKKKIQRGPLEVEEALDYAMQITKGLSRAHAAGIVHRDIKPANVLVIEEGTVKLLDFGIAKMIGTDVTEEGAALGTAPYMSPEQARGKAVDHRTDLWSLGVVLHEMLTGEQPFRGDYYQAVIYSILNEEPEPVKGLRPEVSEQLERVVEKLLRKNPTERYQRADEVLADLQALSSSDSSMSTHRRGGLLQSRWRQHVWAGFIALVFGLSVLGFLLWWQAPGPERSPAAASAVSSQQISLAVLPLENNTGDPDQAYFADGMSEALIAELAHIEVLRVVSLMWHDESRKPLADVLRESNVGVVLEGGIVSSEDQVDIRVWLTEVGTNDVLWSERFEEDLRDLLMLQRKVAQAVAREIAGTLTPQEEARLATVQTVDEEAIRLYLKGLQVRHNQDRHLNALRYFEQAVEKDPDFAHAWAWLANLSAIWKDKAKAERAIDKALTLNPSLPEAYVALGQIREWINWDWDGAEQAFRRAIELKPGDAEAHHELGQLLMRSGQFEGALAEMKQALQVNPLAPRFHLGIGEVYFYWRRYDEALKVFEEVAEQFPIFSNAHWYIGHVYLQKGMTEQAIKQFEQWGDPGDLGMVYALAGRSAEAWKAHKTLEEAPPRACYGSCPFNLISIPAALGDKETALDWLERTYDQRLGLLVYLKIWPQFDSLRAEPRFQAVLKKVGLDT